MEFCLEIAVLSLSLSVKAADDLVDLKKPEVTGLEVSPASPGFSDSMIRELGVDGEAASTEGSADDFFFLLAEWLRLLWMNTPRRIIRPSVATSSGRASSRCQNDVKIMGYVLH